MAQIRVRGPLGFWGRLSDFPRLDFFYNEEEEVSKFNTMFHNFYRSQNTITKMQKRRMTYVYKGNVARVVNMKIS